MDLNLILPAAVAANTLISCGTAIYALLTSGSKKNGEAIADHERRIQSVESDVKHLPDRKMVHDLQLTLKDIQIEMASIKTSTEQSTRTSRRVEEFLLRKGEAA